MDALSDNQLINLLFSTKKNNVQKKTHLKGNKMGLLNQKYVLFAVGQVSCFYMNVYRAYKVSQMYSVLLEATFKLKILSCKTIIELWN